MTPAITVFIGRKEKETIFSLNFKCNECATSAVPCIGATVTLHPTYPEQVPKVTVGSRHLTREAAHRLTEDLAEHTDSLIGEAMILQLVMQLKSAVAEHHHLASAASDHTANEETAIDNFYTALLHLDHMRNRTKYSKTIMKWSDEMNLTGRLIFCDKLILILLQGRQRNIKVSTTETVMTLLGFSSHDCSSLFAGVHTENENC